MNKSTGARAKKRVAKPVRASKPKGHPSTKRGQAIYARAKAVIPGGTQLLSKRPEMFLPGQWPSYFERAAGCRVWDYDGNEFTDMSYCGIGSTVLGYADPDVDRAVKQAIAKGTMTTLNCREEVELAELLVELHPWADMVRFQRGGGEAMSVAIRIARAHTRRQIVAFSGYHGWHDWYLAANLATDDRLAGHLLPGLDPLGVPDALRGTAVPFRFNHLDELKAIIASHGDQLAAVVMEPYRSMPPDDGFLNEVKRLANAAGALMVIDEITIGWRMATGGAHLKLGVTPDIAVFAKAMGNGYPISAVVGTRAAMEAAQGSFISSTFWTERIGPVAALATIQKHRDRDVPAQLARVGNGVRQAWSRAAKAAKLSIELTGVAPLSHFNFAGMERPAEAKTAFTQLMLDRGFLANTSFYSMAVHSDADVQRYAVAAEESFDVIARAANGPGVASLLRGPVAHSGFHRLN